MSLHRTATTFRVELETTAILELHVQTSCEQTKLFIVNTVYKPAYQALFHTASRCSHRCSYTCDSLCGTTRGDHSGKTISFGLSVSRKQSEGHIQVYDHHGYRPFRVLWSKRLIHSGEFNGCEANADRCKRRSNVQYTLC